MNDLSKIAEEALKKEGLLSIKINSISYTIELLPATQALAIGTQLLKVFLPAIGAYADGVKKEESVLPEDFDLFTDIGLLVATQLEKVSVLDIVAVLTQNVKKNGEVVDIDSEFKGNLGGFIALIEFILKENCGSFFIDYLQTKGIDLSLLEKKSPQEETPS